MKKLISSSITCFISIILTAQITAPEIEWQNTIGGESDDYLFSVQQTLDGGYILGGYSYSGISGDKTEPVTGDNDYWVVKTDAFGVIEWQKTIKAGGEDKLYSVMQTSEGGYILGGHSRSNSGGDKSENKIGEHDYWVVKLDSSGIIEWDNTIGGSKSDKLKMIIQTLDGGYFLAGYSDSNISGDKTEKCNGEDDYWVVKLDSSGEIEWENTIGGDDEDQLQSGIQTSDGGYLLGGSSISGISEDKSEGVIGGENFVIENKDYWVVKLNASGEIEWENTIGGNNDEELESIIQVSDGSYILGGHSDSDITGDKIEISHGGADDYWVIKINGWGIIEWQNSIGAYGTEIIKSVVETSDGGFLLGGYSNSGIDGDKTEPSFGPYYTFDYWVVKIDGNGNVLWENTIGGSDNDVLNSVNQTADGGFILGGYSESNISFDKTEASLGRTDYWIIKIYPECILESAITPTGSTSFCAGGSVILNAPVDESYTYQWKKNGVNISGAISSSYTANNTGNFQVFISNGTCDALSDEVAVTKNAKPKANINNLDATNDICIDPSIKLKTGSGTGYTYQWYKDSLPIPGATSVVYFATEATYYNVKVTNSFGCTKTSVPYTIVNSCRTGDENDNVVIYPNPAQTELFIRADGFTIDEIKTNIYSSTGQKIFSESHTISEFMQINIAAFAAGIYTIIISDNTRMTTKQFVKE